MAELTYSADYAKEFAESEFEKYRIIQDRLFQSDFDRLMDVDDLFELPEADFFNYEQNLIQKLKQRPLVDFAAFRAARAE